MYRCVCLCLTVSVCTCACVFNVGRGLIFWQCGIHQIMVHRGGLLREGIISAGNCSIAIQRVDLAQQNVCLGVVPVDGVVTRERDASCCVALASSSSSSTLKSNADGNTLKRESHARSKPRTATDIKAARASSRFLCAPRVYLEIVACKGRVRFANVSKRRKLTGS